MGKPGRCTRCGHIKQKCSLAVKVSKNASESAEVAAVVESPKKRSGVGKALESVKQMVVGSKAESSSGHRNGARPLLRPSNSVNRAEVVITVPPKKPVPLPIPPVHASLDSSSVLPEPVMGPPPSSSPSIRSFAPSTSSRQTAPSRKRHRGDEYELSRLRHDFNASQEELALVKRQYAGYRESTEAYIKELHRELGAPSDEEAEPKGKGKGRAM